MARKTHKSRELKLTLSELETAIHAFDNVSSQPVKEGPNPSLELSQRAQALLRKLREQLNELSE